MPELTHFILLRLQREQAMLDRIFEVGWLFFFSTMASFFPFCCFPAGATRERERKKAKREGAREKSTKREGEKAKKKKEEEEEQESGKKRGKEEETKMLQ